MRADNVDGRLARVRKLLAKAEDPAVTPEEAETYTAKAAELIAAYGIDRAMLAALDPDSDVPGDRRLDVDAPYARDKAELLWTVARSCRCKGVLKTSHTRQLTMHLFGYGSDLERLELLFTSLLVQLANGLAATPVPAWEHAAAFRRTWILGFTVAIARRLAEAEERAAATAQEAAPSQGRSVALVLADRSDVVERQLKDAYPVTRPARDRFLTGGGYHGGYAAGQRADLGGTRLAPRRPALD